MEVSENNNPKTEVFNCNACGRDTMHEIVAEHALNDCNYDEEDDNWNNQHTYLIVRCRGCRNGSFVHRKFIKVFNSDERIPDDTPYPSDKFYEEMDEWRKEFLPLIKSEERSKLPKTIRNLYEEIEIAFLHETRVLAGIGLRTLLEALCQHVNAQGNNLQAKIQDLNQQGLISVSEIPFLDKLRLVGNISAHQIKSWPIKQLTYALRILNHLLEKVFILPKIKDKIKAV